jgi:hypothetical protein
VEFGQWAPVVTAALTLINTVILVWNQQKVRQIRDHVDGMHLQLLAEAERRGRRSALRGAARAEGRPADPV